MKEYRLRIEMHIDERMPELPSGDANGNEWIQTGQQVKYTSMPVDLASVGEAWYVHLAAIACPCQDEDMESMSEWGKEAFRSAMTEKIITGES